MTCGSMVPMGTEQKCQYFFTFTILSYKIRVILWLDKGHYLVIKARIYPTPFPTLKDQGPIYTESPNLIGVGVKFTTVCEVAVPVPFETLDEGNPNAYPSEAPYSAQRLRFFVKNHSVPRQPRTPTFQLYGGKRIGTGQPLVLSPAVAPTPQ
jgi:hypothetical protein